MVFRHGVIALGIPLQYDAAHGFDHVFVARAKMLGQELECFNKLGGIDPVSSHKP
jgi:hypothetical protein